MVAWAIGHSSLAQPSRWVHSGLAMAPGCGPASKVVPFIFNHQTCVPWLQQLPGRWQWSVLRKRCLIQIHMKTTMGLHGEALRVSLSPLCLLGVGLLTTGDLCTGLGPLPPSLLLSSLTSTLTEAAFVGSPHTHMHVTLWAEDLQKPLGGRF